MRTAGVAAWIVLGFSVVAGQIEVAQQETPSQFNMDAISFASADSAKSRIDVYVQVPYANLSFVKSDDQYRASYDITIDVLDSSSRVITEKIWTEEVKSPTFAQTVSSQGYSLVQRSFDVVPGNYSITTLVRDNESRQSRRQTRSLLVSNYNTSGLALSDIMLINRITVSGDRRTIVPNISQNVGMVADSFHVFFEAYNRAGLDSIRLKVDVLSGKKENVLGQIEMRPLHPGRNQIFITIPNTSLSIGNYALYVRAYADGDSSDSSKTAIASTNRTFIVRWRGLPQSIKDIDLAIEQCVYIAKDKEMDYMREAKTLEEKQSRFLEFWKKRDPNPNTPRNEKMEQYFERVEFANKSFKHYIEGWRTDMGMVYIIFGPPNNVDRHPFDVDSKPYEVWTYYEINYSFVFVDQTGFGDYRLTTPIWNVWQRPKD